MTRRAGPAGRHRVDRRADSGTAAGWDASAAPETPATGRPVADGPARDRLTADGPARDRPAADRLVGDGPAELGSLAEPDRPVGDRPVDRQPLGWNHPTVAEHPVDRGYRAVGEPRAVRRQPPVRRRGDRLRTVARGVGELLLTCGAVLLLFVVYEIWASNISADRQQDRVRQRLATAWQRGQDPLKGVDRLNLPVGRQVVLPAGQGFANLYIPAFGKDYARTIVQGTSDRDLDSGPGHYVTSQLPGQLGNFAVAGHRVGRGEPFLNLDKLHPGDTIVVQTASNWYVYAVLGSRSAYLAASRIADPAAREAAVAAALAAPDRQGVRGREIVAPSAVQVIAPVPDHPRATASRALLTLTTCHPKYSASRRLVVHAQLVRAVPHTGAVLPRELPGGTI